MLSNLYLILSLVIFQTILLINGIFGKPTIEQIIFHIVLEKNNITSLNSNLLYNVLSTLTQNLIIYLLIPLAGIYILKKCYYHFFLKAKESSKYISKILDKFTKNNLSISIIIASLILAFVHFSIGNYIAAFFYKEDILTIIIKIQPYLISRKEKII